MQRFARSLFAPLLVLALLLTACGGGQPAPTATTQPPAPTSAPAATSAPADTPTSAPAATAAPADTPTSAPAPTATPPPATPTSAPPALPADPKAAVIAALQNQLKAGPFRTKTTIVADTGTTEMTAEVIPPDKIRTKLESGEFEMESVFIGDQGWMKRDDAWEVAPVSGDDLFQQIGLMTTAEELDKTISNVQAAGRDKVNGEDALVFTYTSTFGEAGPDQVVSQVKLWVSASRGLPLQSEIEGEAAGIKSKSRQVIEYDPDIEITPPM